MPGLEERRVGSGGGGPAIGSHCNASRWGPEFDGGDRQQSHERFRSSCGSHAPRLIHPVREASVIHASSLFLCCGRGSKQMAGRRKACPMAGRRKACPANGRAQESMPGACRRQCEWCAVPAWSRWRRGCAGSWHVPIGEGRLGPSWTVRRSRMDVSRGC